MEVLRKNGVSSSFVFPLVSVASRPDYVSGATFAAGDVKILRHTGGVWNVANVGTLPTEISTTGVYYMPLTATELTPDDIVYPVVIKIVDQTSPKIWDDTAIIVTFKTADDVAAILVDTALVKGYTDTIEGVLGTPVGASLSADIAAVKADTVLIKGYTDTVEASLTTALADLVLIKGYTDSVEASLTTLLADSTTVKADLVLIKGYTDTVEASLTTALADLVTIGADAVLIKGYTDTVEASLTTALADLVTLKADTGVIQGYTDTLEASLTTALADLVLLKGYTDTLEASATTLLADTVTLKSDTSTIKSDLTTTKNNSATIVGKLPLSSDAMAGDLDVKDIKAKALVIYTALPAQTATIASQDDVLAIQNNTNFSASIIQEIIIPVAPDVKWIPISVQLRDSGGAPEDPDSNELTVQMRCDTDLVNYTDLYDELGGASLIGSTTFTPDFYLLKKIDTGIYEAWIKVVDTITEGSYTFTFKYKEATVVQIYTRNTAIMTEAPTVNIEIANSPTNQAVIAQAMRDIDISDTPTTTGSVLKTIIDEMGIIINKLPSGTISDLSLSTTVESITISEMFSMLMAMFNGNYTINTETGMVTFFKRDDITPLSIVKVTETQRERQLLPS